MGRDFKRLGREGVFTSVELSFQTAFLRLHNIPFAKAREVFEAAGAAQAGEPDGEKGGAAGGAAGQFVPGQLGVAVVGEVQVVVEEDETQPARGVEVPCAVVFVERREGVVGVLQRAPREGEGGVAGEPARPCPAQRPCPEKLPCGRAEHFEAGGGGQAVERADVVVGAGLYAAALAEGADQGAADGGGGEGVNQHAGGGDEPVNAGVDGVPLGVFQPQDVAFVQDVELFGGGAVVAVVGEVEDALDGEAGGKPCRRQSAAPFVQTASPPVGGGGEHAVHAFVQQGEDGVVAEGKQQRGGDGNRPRRVRGGGEQGEVGA
ncbi:hypothetical protein HMPREF9120_00342 [Neisseria sp. oral taxon 020 str. F0370]|nr:hypothetical protein HMPREF9120_00342 [Neisseria sp. oral taxon 020 str. F0370]